MSPQIMQSEVPGVTLGPILSDECDSSDSTSDPDCSGEEGTVHRAEYLARGSSDHSPLMVTIGRKSKGVRKWRQGAWDLQDWEVAHGL
ncbi:hypothetical protein NDU88_005001 [Pleurodeles waltl]|uniref:Uncharacterized protein n=1 Tax=Pleurodeles waltl TaxID=8319 RepID=A0AAV7LJY6_PLEWA|nr:hypothetical protein NDU88_005001 [Pleurodeles waltl]